MGRLIIEDLEFETKNARLLFSKCRHGLAISIFVDTHSKRVGRHSWEPDVTFENVGFRAQSVADLSGKKFRFKKSYLELFGDYPQIICVFEHNDIRDSELSFSEFSTNKIRLLWNAKCDVFYDEKYGKDLKLVVDTELDIDANEYPKEPSAYAKLV